MRIVFHEVRTSRLRRLAVREGIYLFEHGIDPYSGGAFRHVSRYHALVFSAPHIALVASPSVAILHSAPVNALHVASAVGRCRLFRRMGFGSNMEAKNGSKKHYEG